MGSALIGFHSHEPTTKPKAVAARVSIAIISARMLLRMDITMTIAMVSTVSGMSS
jgi:hypothetical protein